MTIKTAEFVCSSAKIEQCPQSNLPEYAFIGRSNVGKSSLINMLTGKKNLAKVSSTPGKTQLINHFIINNAWHLVDLPGYGYAKVSKTSRGKFSKIILDYISQRQQMTLLFVLIDSRHKPQKIDIEFLNMLGEHEVPFAIIFTKADKLGRNIVSENIGMYKVALHEWWEELPPIFSTSAEIGTGRDNVLQYIDDVNASLKKS